MEGRLRGNRKRRLQRRVQLPHSGGGLHRGYAVINTDEGTAPATPLNGDAIVGHPVKWRDWGFRSTHLMTVAGKQIARPSTARSRPRLFLRLLHRRSAGAQRSPTLSRGLRRHRRRRAGRQPHASACRLRLEPAADRTRQRLGATHAAPEGGRRGLHARRRRGCFGYVRRRPAPCASIRPRSFARPATRPIA